jgi:hypothetical protein
MINPGNSPIGDEDGWHLDRSRETPKSPGKIGGKYQKIVISPEISAGKDLFMSFKREYRKGRTISSPVNCCARE